LWQEREFVGDPERDAAGNSRFQKSAYRGCDLRGVDFRKK